MPTAAPATTRTGRCAPGRRATRMSRVTDADVAASGHLPPRAELRTVPGAAPEDPRQLHHRVPCIGIAQVERREAEAQLVGGMAVAYDAGGDQRLHIRISIRMPIRDVAPAPLAF